MKNKTNWTWQKHEEENTEFRYIRPIYNYPQIILIEDKLMSVLFRTHFQKHGRASERERETIKERNMEKFLILFQSPVRFRWFYYARTKTAAATPTPTPTITTTRWNNRKVFFLGKCIWGLNDLFVECKNFWFYLLYPLSCSSSIWLVCVVAQDDDVYTHVFMQKILCHSPINFHFYTMNLWLNAIYSCKKSRYE